MLNYFILVEKLKIVNLSTNYLTKSQTYAILFYRCKNTQLQWEKVPASQPGFFLFIAIFIDVHNNF